MARRKSQVRRRSRSRQRVRSRYRSPQHMSSKEIADFQINYIGQNPVCGMRLPSGRICGHEAVVHTRVPASLQNVLDRVGIANPNTGICRSCLPFAVSQVVYKGGTLAAGSTLDWGDSMVCYPEYLDGYMDEPTYKKYYAP